MTRTLKEDELGRVELLTTPTGPVLRRVACGSRLPGTGLVARILCRREERALRILDGEAGTPRLIQDRALGALPGLKGSIPRKRDILLRSYVEGVPLYAADRLPKDFFELLTDLVRRLHGKGICHNDLHKEPNILVQPDGRPAVIDFQLASHHPRGGRTFDSRAAEDLRHVDKHRRRYFRGTDREEAGAVPAKASRSFIARAWARFGKPPYNFVTRRMMTHRETEGRRPSTGPWPEWDEEIGAGK